MAGRLEGPRRAHHRRREGSRRGNGAPGWRRRARRVALSDIDEEGGKALAAELEAGGAEGHVHHPRHRPRRPIGRPRDPGRD